MKLEISGLVRIPPNSSREIVSINEAVFEDDGLNLVYGPSGSGKTSLLRLIAGLDRPTRGSITVDGTQITSMSTENLVDYRRKNIGYIFQDTNLVPELRAWENVVLPLVAEKEIELDDARREAQKALAEVGLEGLGERFPQKMSGGEQQRVGVARALFGNRSVILADEPTGALDSTNSAMIFETLRHLAETGRLVILVSHDLAARDYARRLYEIKDGRLITP